MIVSQFETTLDSLEFIQDGSAVAISIPLAIPLIQVS